MPQAGSSTENVIWDHTALQPPYASCNFHHWRPGRTMDWHGHDFWQYIGVRSGTLDVDWGEGWVSIPAGDAHVLPPGGRHRLRSASGHTQMGINFSATYSEHNGDGRSIVSELKHACPRPLVVSNGLDQQACAALQHWCDRQDRLRTIGLLTALDVAMVHLLQALQGGDDQQRQHMHRVVQDYADGPVTVEQLAREMGLARSTLQARCHHMFNCGIMALHERLRLERAGSRLLRNAQASIAAVATASGYADQATFSRRFKIIMGAAPLVWRRTHQDLQG